MAAKFTLGRYKLTQQILNILDVTEETRKDFLCAECGGRIVCVLDVPLTTRHFRHKSANSNCKPALETLLHKTAKEIICANNSINLPGRPAFAYSGKPEISFSKYRPDVTLYGKEKNLLVEIEVSHPMTYEKHLDYQQQGADCLVIDLSNYPRVFHLSDLENEIIQQTDRKNFYGCQNAYFKPIGNYEAKVSPDNKNPLAKTLIRVVAFGIGCLIYKRFFSETKQKKRRIRSY
ncbi:hypothetical protein [Pedobacter nyackensis]|uniref:hypothetical protein n=1 Tax=Pedobacter nyackensis TaxID=475255 RepID=UPI00292CC976|nr:hypothetical protein [Pedobacter nyackensis]